MALVMCPECNREISDKAAACIHCGCPIKADQSARPQTIDITITSADQFFIASATNKIFLNGSEVAWSGNGQSVTVQAPAGKNTVLIKASIRKKELTFISNSNVKITTKWNRLTGALSAICTGDDVQIP